MVECRSGLPVLLELPPWKAAMPAWHASPRNQPSGLSGSRRLPHSREPTISASAAWVPPGDNPACVGVPISFFNLYCKSSARAFSAQRSGILELLFCTAPCRATHSVFRWTCMNIILSTWQKFSGGASHVVKPSLLSGVSDLHPMYEE